MIILFKIIRFNLKKISEINTSQVQYRGYSTESRGFRLNFVTHWKINENDCKDTCKDGSKSYCCTCLARTKTFPGSYLLLFVIKLWKREYRRYIYFFSPSTGDFKMQTSHTVRLEITPTPQAGIFFSSQHRIKKIAQYRNTANPQCPLLIAWYNSPHCTLL